MQNDTAKPLSPTAGKSPARDLPSDERPPAGTWAPLKLPAVAARLTEVRDLLRQAAAVGLAQDVARVESLQTLQQASDPRAQPQPRRYR